MSHHCERPQDGTRIWSETDGLHVDVRGLDPPEPMVAILALIESGEAGTVLTAHLDREPIFLYPELDERGWDHELLPGCAHGEHDDEVKLRMVNLHP